MYIEIGLCNEYGSKIIQNTKTKNTIIEFFIES